MKTRNLQLTKGLSAKIDAVDYAWLSRWKWFAVADGERAYAQTNMYVGGKRKGVKLHRFIMGLDGPVVDHIDGDGLNNTRSNLRHCLPHENAANQRKQKDRSSRFKGVYWNKQCRKWRSRIKTKGVLVDLGLFNDENLAAAAYNKAARALFGVFARENKSAESWVSR